VGADLFFGQAKVGKFQVIEADEGSAFRTARNFKILKKVPARAARLVLEGRSFSSQSNEPHDRDERDEEKE
jgi:hypothetical protein